MATHGRSFRANSKYRRSGFSRHLWKTTALSTLALALSGIAAHAGDTGLWQPQVRAIIGANNNGGNTAIEGFLPLKQNLESVLFLDVRSKYDFDDGFGQDVGLGVRRIVNPDLMIGGYAYLNIQNHDSHQFVASTLGLEAITSKYDAHVNVYLPISGDRSTAGQESSLSLVGHQLIEQISAIAHRDYAAWGIEGEVGVQVPLNLPENHSLRFDVGAYHFGDPDGDDGSITGAKAGLEYSIGDVIGKGTSLTFTGEVRNDNRDDTQFAGSIRLTVPLNAFDKGSSSADDGAEPVYPVSPGLRKRVNERVRGDIGVRIESQDKVTGTSTRVAINAATNTAFGQFFFADGDNDALGLGTIGDPTTLDNAVAGAGANGVVVALGGKGNITTAGVTLANGQTVIGGDGGVQARLVDGSIGTYNFGGSNGTLQGTNPANNVLTLANGNTLSGIIITGGKDGIFGNNIAGATLTNVTVTGTVGHGADFTGTLTGVNGSNFTATGNGLDGLHIEGDGTYNFIGTTLLQANGDDGLDITGHGTYTFATLNALDNNDAGITVKGTGVAGSITITGGQVSGNKALGDDGVGVFIDPITAHIVLDSITQTGGASGVVLENLSGSFTVNGATTISNTTGPAIAITDSPAAIRFGDIDITDPGTDGMVFTGVNASVIAGNIIISGLGSGIGLDFSGSQTNFTAQSLNINGTGAAGSIGIDLSSPSAGGATIVITDGGAIANVDTGVRFGISGSPANSANAQFSFGDGSIAGITASLDARGLNQTLGLYAFGSTTFSGPQLFDQQNVIFVGGIGSLGDGSSTSSLLAINQADLITNGTAIFVLVNDGTPIDASGGFSLSAGQTLASFGNGRTFSLGGIPVNVTGDNVQHDQVVSDPGGAATLTDTGTGDAVTLANNTSLLDFNIAGVANGNGVHGSGVSNITMSGLNVSGASLNGVLFDSSNSVTGNNLNSSDNTGHGLLVDNGNGSYNFTGTTILSNNAGYGLFVIGGGTYGFETLDAKDNGGVGVDVTSTGGGSLTITGGTVSGNGLMAVSVGTFGLINPIGLDVTLDTVSQAGGQTGIGLFNVGGNFSVTGTTTTSNTLFDGIFITSSSATVDFGGAVTITQPSRDGISISNSSGATTFGTVTINQAGRNGILLNGNSGAITFGDASIGQPTQSGIDVQGANGTIAFANIDITGLPTGKTGLDLSGSQSTFTATSLDITGVGSSTGIDLSGTTGGSVTIGTGVISAGTGVQMGTHGAAGTSANTTFSFGAAGGGTITGTTASLDMRGLMAGSGTYAFNATHLVGPQLFDTANVIFVGAANTGTGSGASVGDLINADAADGLTTDANTIFVLVNDGAGTINTDADGFTLADGQQIVSFANGNTVALGGPPANVTGAEVVTSGTQVDPFGNGAATLNNAAGSAIDLANGNRVADLSVSNAGSGSAINGTGVNGLTVDGVTVISAVTALDLTGASGAIGVTNLNIQTAQNGILLANSSAAASFTDVTMGGVTGIGLALSNYSGAANFTNFDITGAGTGVSINAGSIGTMTFDAASSIAGTTGVAFSIDTAAPNLTYNGTINQTAAASAVKINAMTGGTATFGGKITASTGLANAIDLTGNTGGTINFTGGLDLTTDGGFAFSAINGGTLSVTGTNTVATGAGLLERGIQLGGAGGLTIGAAGVTFASVTVDGSGGIVPSGIVIENTTGGTVTFGGVNINRVNGDAIRLTNVANAVTFNGTTTIDTVVGGGPGFVVQGSAATVNVNNLVTTLVSGDDVNLANNTGTINIGGTITNVAGNGVVVFGGSAAITVSANISSSATAPGTAVKIDGTTGGSVQFSGSVTSTGTGNLFDIGSTLAPAGGAISFTGPTLSATGGGGAVVGGLIGTATLNVTTPLSITNALGTGLSVSGVASTASATFGAVTVTGAGGIGINIVGNGGPVTFGTTQVTMGATAGTAGINFAGTNADVTFGTTNVTLGAGANQTGVDFSGSATTADFGLTTITGLGDLTSRGIDLSSTTGNKVITFLQGSKIDNVGIGVELSSGQTTATSANATFTFGDGDSTDGLESFITAAAGGFTVNTVGLDPTLGNYDFDDVFFTGSANLATAPGSVTLVSQSGGFIAAGTTGNLSMGVNTISLAAADALTGTQNFAFVGTINLGATAFTLDSGQTITGFGNSNVVSTGTIQPANVQGNLGATGGNITGDESVVSGTGDFMHLLGDNAVRHTIFDFTGATGSVFVADQGAAGFSNANGITIEGVTISNVAANRTAVSAIGLNGGLSVINNSINIAGTLLDVNGGTGGTISVSRGFLPNGGPAGTLTGGGINIANRTGGAVTFTDQVTITGGNGVSISGGTAGGAVNFNGGLDITTSLATGLSLSGLNVLTVANAGSTTITATGQTALSLQGTLGAGGVNFDSITSSGGTSGIILNGVTGAVNVSGATSITGTSGFGIDVTGANTGTFTFGAVTVNNTATAGGGIHVVSGTVNVTGLANIDTTSGVGLSQSGGTTSFTGGLTIDTTTGTAIVGTGGTMGITATGGAETVNSTLGQAISLSGVAATIALDSTSSGGGTNNVSLANVTGTVGLGSGSFTGATGTAFDVSGGTVSASYSGNITKANAGALVSVANHSAGTIAFSTGTLSATAGTGLQFNNASGIYNFNGTTTLNGGDAGIDILNSSGTFTFGSATSITNPTGVGFFLDGGSASVAYHGSVATNGGFAVDIRNHNAGTITFDTGNVSSTFGGIQAAGNSGGTINFAGPSYSFSTGINSAVAVGNNTGATINFTGGGLAITTTSADGFVAIGGGTISVTGGGNTISTDSGTALRLDGVTVGAGGVNFNSVSTTSAASGITLNNVASSGGGAIALGTVNLQGITSRGVDVSGTLGAALSFNDLDIGLNSITGVAFDLNGATINAAITANDFDVTNAAAAGTSIGVDLRGAIGGQTVRLGDAAVGGNSSSISGVNTGVFLNSTTNLAFTYGDGESATDQNSTISANVGIDASSAPVAGTYNFDDVNFQSSPGLGFGIGKVYFVDSDGATGGGDGSGKDGLNPMTLAAAEAAAGVNDIIVLVNNGNAITAFSTNADNTLNLQTGEQVRGFGNGNINLALTVPSTIHLASNSIVINDPTSGGAATLTTTDGNFVISTTVGGNIIDGFTIDGNDGVGLNAARGIAGSGGTNNTTVSHMTIRNVSIFGADLGAGAVVDTVSFSGNVADLRAGDGTFSNITASGTTNTSIMLNGTGLKTLSNISISNAGNGLFLAQGGTVNATNVDISNTSSLGLVVQSDVSATFDVTSSISGITAGTAVAVINRTGGTLTYNGTVAANGAASGISISGATAANTVSFTGAVDLGTTTALTGTAVVISINVTGSTASFADVDIITNGTTGFTASNGGTVNVTTGTVSSTGAQAVNLNGITTTGINFTSTTSTGGSNNVALINVTGAGTVSLGTGALSGASGAAFLVSGGSANISYGGSVTKATAGNVVSISSRTGGTTTLSGNLSATGGVANGILVNANTGGTINFSGTTKTLTTGANNAVDLTTNTGTAINFAGGGLAINTTSGIGFNAAGGGTVTVTGSGNTISTGSGVAVNMDTVAIGAGGVTFASTNKGAGGTSAVILDTVTGSGAIDLGTGALVGGTSAVIRIGDGAGTANSGGTAAFTYAGTITSGTGQAVNIQDRAAVAGNITLSGNISHNVAGVNGIQLDDNAAGTITFSGASKSITSGSAIAVNLTDNTGATIDFINGGLVINTTGAAGFNATGGGTVTVQGTGNSIASTNGTALNVVNTFIGGSGLTFQSVSANGGTNGLVLNNTGLAAGNGGLTVTGTGVTAGSGGTIQNTVQGALFTSTKNLSLSNMNFTNANTGNGTLNNVDGPTFNSAAQAAINMSSVATVTFTNLNLNGGAQVGINGQNVSNMTIANTTVTGFGNAVFEGNMRFYNLTGTSSITNSTFSFAAGAGGDNLVDIRNDSGTSLTLNISGSTFSNTKLSANGAQGLSFEAFGTASATVNISNSSFLSLKTSGVEAFARDTSTLNVNITDGGTVGNGNTFDPQGGLGRAIGLNAEDTAHLNFKILNNKKIYGNGGPVINVFGINNAVIMGRINNNADIKGGGVGSAGSAIFIHPEDASTGIIEIVGNTITGTGNDPAIFATPHGDGAGPSTDNGSLDLTIMNNNIALSGTGVAGSGAVGIDVRAGSNAGDLTNTYLNISGNTVTLAQPADDIAFLARIGSTTSHLYFQNFVGGANNQAIATAIWNAGGNTPAGSVFSFDAGGAPAYAAIPGGHNGGLVLVPTN
ncbi:MULTISPECIES: hypothetical protein [unclassified Mesorhizobium]|uniref:hypothetical protein n=1 Tax=unclassified Mesorhizobium TaxID=325217 RepID=UPI003335E1FF